MGLTIIMKAKLYRQVRVNVPNVIKWHAGCNETGKRRNELYQLNTLFSEN
jgi:hypothetical protein